MKKDLLVIMFGVLVITAGIQPTLVKAEGEIIQAGKILAGSVTGAAVYGLANYVATKNLGEGNFARGFYGTSSSLKKGERAKKENPLVQPLKLATLLTVCAIPAARLGTWPKLGMQDLVKPLTYGVGGLLTAEAFAGYVGYQNLPSNFAGDIRKWTNAGLWASNVATGGGIALGGLAASYILLKRYTQ